MFAYVQCFSTQHNKFLIIRKNVEIKPKLSQTLDIMLICSTEEAQRGSFGLVALVIPNAISFLKSTFDLILLQLKCAEVLNGSYQI